MGHDPPGNMGARRGILSPFGGDHHGPELAEDVVLAGAGDRAGEPVEPPHSEYPAKRTLVCRAARVIAGPSIGGSELAYWEAGYAMSTGPRARVHPRVGGTRQAPCRPSATSWPAGSILPPSAAAQGRRSTLAHRSLAPRSMLREDTAFREAPLW